MKKITAILLLLCLLFALAGCGDSGNWAVPDANRPAQPTPYVPIGQDPATEGTDQTEELPSGASSGIQRSYTVEEIPRTEIAVEGIVVGESITISEEPVVMENGSFSRDNKEQSFSYTAPRDGRYYIRLAEVNANAGYYLRVYDSNENRLASSYKGGDLVELTANETYEIRVIQDSGESSYRLEIYVPKDVRDISACTEIADQIAYQYQWNRYSFTAPISGRYYFEMAEVNANLRYYLRLYDHLDNRLISSYSNGDCVDLEAGETYRVQVQHDSGYGSYVLRICTPKAPRDISGCGAVNDSIQYRYQRNCYTFTAPVSGVYRFSLEEMMSGNSFRLQIYDHLDNRLLSTYSNSDDVELEAGETYTVVVEQDSGTGGYTLVIGYQKETADITGYAAVTDRVTFEKQRNWYVYTPSQPGEYKFSLSGHNAGSSFELAVYDRLQNRLMNTYYDEDSVSLEAGQQYLILVRQYSGLDNYTLNIERTGD